MPTRTQQGDLLSIAYLSHGDTKHIALFPAQPRRVLLHGARGVRPRRALPDAGVRGVRPRHRDERLDVSRASPGTTRYRPDRGKVLERRRSRTDGAFSRYLDVDGDGIAARSLPGVVAARRLLHARLGTQQARDVHRGLRRVSGSRRPVGAKARDRREGRARARVASHRARWQSAPIGIVSLGGCHAAVLEAVDRLRGSGHVDRLHAHPRAFRSQPSVRAFLEAHRRCYVVEQNRDGQLRTLLAIETGLRARQHDRRFSTTAGCR